MGSLTRKTDTGENLEILAFFSYKNSNFYIFFSFNSINPLKKISIFGEEEFFPLPPASNYLFFQFIPEFRI